MTTNYSMDGSPKINFLGIKNEEVISVRYILSKKIYIYRGIKKDKNMSVIQHP